MALKEKLKDKINAIKGSKTFENLERIKKLKAIKKIRENKQKFIETAKRNKGKIFAGIGISAVMTVSFKSDESLNFDTSKIDVPETKNIVILGKNILSIEDFYRNVNDTRSFGVWYYTNPENQKIEKNINTNVNHRYLNNLRATYNKDKKINFQYKDVYLSYKIDTVKCDTTNVICYMEEKLSDKLSSKTLGHFQRWGREVVVNVFHPDTTLSAEKQLELRDIIKKDFDTGIIETKTHELGHDDNDQKGINLRAGLGAKRNLKLSKHDEVVANIKQFLKQRQNYIITGDEKYITSKFKFYLHDIKKAGIKPSLVHVSKEEQEIIGKGVRNMWIRLFAGTYRKDHFKNLRINLENDDITYESLDAEERYENILQRIYKIKTPLGVEIDFRPIVEDFALTKGELSEIKKIEDAKPLNEMDKLGMILDRYGEKAYHSYIVEQKQKVKEADKQKQYEESRKHQLSQGKKPIPIMPNKEAILNDEKRFAQNRKQRRNGR